MAYRALTCAGLFVIISLVEGKSCGNMLQLRHRENPGFEELAKGMSIPNDEIAMRKRLYDKAVAEINAQNAKKGKLWTAAITDNSLLTDQEEQKLYGYMKTTGAKTATIPRDINHVNESSPPAAELPAEIDWRTVQPSVVTPVKNQGACGSCWAFASTAVMESVIAIQTGRLYELSPQQVTSCTPNPEQCGGSGGCSGATAQLAFDYVSKVGLSSIWTWPYTSGTQSASGICFENKVNLRPVAGITGYHQLTQNDADELMRAVVQNPVSVSVAASAWKHYDQGIFDGCSTEKPILNHAVVLMGYGYVCTEDFGTVYYWLVRNSWGPAWGEEGYIRLRRYPYGEPCGWDDEPLDGYSCASNPPRKIKACGMCGILSDSAYPTGAYQGPPSAPEDPAVNPKAKHEEKVPVAAHAPSFAGIPDGADGASFMQDPTSPSRRAQRATRRKVEEL
eukprot:TRINITY_DN31083_c0_g1_i1.p1 TRINITY_DN31083_c0_g1~~TRINITY_DN31083_c0_g1_i1.p1  ORF type:complete len:449 (+),score=109.19 TRINITY_DN31083_c0_g1_i1:75-1421(+)